MLAVAGVLMLGIRETARTNTIMVVTKLAVLVLFIVLAFTAFKSDNLSPFMPGGVSSVSSAAALIFFAYIAGCWAATAGRRRRPRASSGGG